MIVVYQIGYCFYFLAAVLAFPFVRKVRLGLIGRVGLMKRVHAACAPRAYFWFHVASSGEFEQCLPIMDKLKALAPDEKILLSYFSPSGKRGVELEIIRREKAQAPLPWDYADYSPLDFVWTVAKWIRITRPKALICINKEIWPGVLFEAKKRKIPCFLFATYFSEKSKRHLSRYQRYLSQFQLVGTVVKSTTEVLKGLLPDATIETLGDPRIDRVIQRKAFQRTAAWEVFFNPARVGLFASIWEEDFENLKPSLEALLGKREWRLILVPHEPHGKLSAEILAYFRSRDLPMRRWTHWQFEPDDHSHLLVDTVGILAELYRVATFVFVGGSFKGRIHNVLEPAAYAKPLFTGPYIDNSAEALTLSETDQGLFTAATGDDLKTKLLNLIQDEAALKKYRHRLEHFLLQNAGAGERYSRRLLESSTVKDYQ